MHDSVCRHTVEWTPSQEVGMFVLFPGLASKRSYQQHKLQMWGKIPNDGIQSFWMKATFKDTKFLTKSCKIWYKFINSNVRLGHKMIARYARSSKMLIKQIKINLKYICHTWQPFNVSPATPFQHQDKCLCNLQLKISYFAYNWWQL